MFLAALAGAVAVWLYTNFPVLTAASERGVRSISGDEAVISEAGDTTLIDFDEASGVFIHKLLFDVSATGSSVYVNVGAATDSTYILIEDKDTPYAATQVVTLDLKGVRSLSIEASAPVLNFRIDNTLDKNLAALIYGALVGAALAALIILSLTHALRPERAFLIIASSMGLAMLISFPSTKVGYDEETHLREVFALASLPERQLSMSHDTLWQLTVTEYSDPEALPEHPEENTAFSAALDGLCVYGEGESTPDFDITVSRIPAYLAMALGARIAMILDLSWSKLLFLTRLCDLMQYVLLMYLAIRITPRGKPLMLFVGLLPEALFMASTCSYDPFIIGMLSLGYALMLRGGRYLAPMLVCMVLGSVVKAVYAPVLLMGLAAAARPKGRRRLLIPSLIVIAFALLIAVFILPTVLHPMDSGDLRGGAVSELVQVSFILSQPLGYAAILIPQMIAWAGRCFAGPDCYTFMGHLVNGSTSFHGYYPFYMIILAVLIALSYRGGSSRDIPERLWMIFMTMLSAVLVWTAMFVAFTEPGATEIAGVQGRYFIPLLFPLYYSLSGHSLARYDGVCYDYVELAELAALALVIWRVCIRVFCV